MQAMTFPLGTTYLIVCAGNDGRYALRIETTNPEQFKMSRVLGVEADPNDLAQLWMVQKTGLDEDSYQIVNCISGNAFDEEKSEIRLKKGKQISDQLFKLEHIKDDFFWIKLDEEGDRAVSLEGILRYTTFNPNDAAQIFRFVKIEQNKLIQRSCILINANSGKALDVPSSTFETDTRIIQYKLNKRFNQRWIFQPEQNGYFIQSLLNGLVLDISGRSREGGSAVIQWEKTGDTNQLWALRKLSSGKVKIQSMHAPGMFLCIKNQSMDDFGKLQIWDEENTSMQWDIDGYVPNE